MIFFFLGSKKAMAILSQIKKAILYGNISTGLHFWCFEKASKMETALAQKGRFPDKVICPLLNALEDIWNVPFLLPSHSLFIAF